jgi:hypothetical protein
MTSKPCIMCEHEPATHGMDCQKCHAVALAMSEIRRNWSPGEYADLAERLRKHSLAEYTRKMREQGSWISARLGAMLVRFCYLSGLDDTAFKTALFRQMQRDAGEIEGLGKIEGGIEAWRKRVYLAAGQCADALFKAARKAHNPKALVP